MNHIMITGGIDLGFSYYNQVHRALDEITQFDRGDDLTLVYFGDYQNATRDVTADWTFAYHIKFLDSYDLDNLDKLNLNLLLVVTDNKEELLLPEQLELYCLTNNVTIYPIEVSEAKEKQIIKATKVVDPIPQPLEISTPYYVPSPDLMTDIPDEVKQNIIEAELAETQQNIQSVGDNVRQMEEQVRRMFERQARQYEKDYHRPVLIAPIKK